MITQKLLWQFANDKNYSFEFFDEQKPQIKGIIYEFYINWKYGAQKPKLDKGIDGIIDEKIGLQIKYRKNKPFEQKDIDYFANCLKRYKCSEGYFITNLKRNEINLFDGLEDRPKITIIYENFENLNEFKLYVNSLFNFECVDIKKKIVVFRDYQKNIINFLDNNTKMENFISMPCGTGKSYIKLFIINKYLLLGQKIVIFFPSKYLVFQFLNLLKSIARKNDGWKTFYEVFKVGCNFSEKKMDYPKINSETQIILSTYKSGNKIQGNFIRIFDEAHHSTAYESLKLTQNNDIKFYFSATFKNNQIENKNIYTLTFDEAIEKKIICDYCIEIWNINSNLQIFLHKNINLDYKDYFLTCLQLDKNEFKNCVVYCNNLQNALLFKKCCSIYKWSNNKKIFYLEGNHSLLERQIVFNEIEKEGGILIVCKILSEGIDLPFLESLCFLDTKYSEIEIIQCIGRILRPYNDKKIAKIILPYNWTGNFDFSNIKSLIKQIYRFNKNNLLKNIKIKDNFEIRDLNLQEFENLKLIIYKRRDFKLRYKLLEEYIKNNNNLPNYNYITENIQLGRWVNDITKDTKKKHKFEKLPLVLEKFDVERRKNISKEIWVKIIEIYVNTYKIIPNRKSILEKIEDNLYKDTINNFEEKIKLDENEKIFKVGQKYNRIKLNKENWIENFKNNKLIMEDFSKFIDEKDILKKKHKIYFMEKFYEKYKKIPSKTDIIENTEFLDLYKPIINIGSIYANIKSSSIDWLGKFNIQQINEQLEIKHNKPKQIKYKDEIWSKYIIEFYSKFGLKEFKSTTVYENMNIGDKLFNKMRKPEKIDISCKLFEGYPEIQNFIKKEKIKKDIALKEDEWIKFIDELCFNKITAIKNKSKIEEFPSLPTKKGLDGIEFTVGNITKTKNQINYFYDSIKKKCKTNIENLFSYVKKFKSEQIKEDLIKHIIENGNENIKEKLIEYIKKPENSEFFEKTIKSINKVKKKIAEDFLNKIKD